LAHWQTALLPGWRSLPRFFYTDAAPIAEGQYKGVCESALLQLLLSGLGRFEVGQAANLVLEHLVFFH
jgi:hypothetical protein